MNYTLKDANKIRVGDTLTLEDGSVHEAVKDETELECLSSCSLYKQNSGECMLPDCRCDIHHIHFKQIKP